MYTIRDPSISPFSCQTRGSRFRISPNLFPFFLNFIDQLFNLFSVFFLAYVLRFFPGHQYHAIYYFFCDSFLFHSHILILFLISFFFSLPFFFLCHSSDVLFASNLYHLPWKFCCAFLSLSLLHQFLLPFSLLFLSLSPFPFTVSASLCLSSILPIPFQILCYSIRISFLFQNLSRILRVMIPHVEYINLPFSLLSII